MAPIPVLRALEAVKSIGRLAWTTVGMVAVLVGVLGGYVFWPQVEFSVGPSLEKTDPLETRFIATNRAYYSLSDFDYICVFKPKYAFQNTKIINGGTGISPDFNAGASQSMRCGISLWQFRDTPTAFMWIVVHFKLPFFPYYQFERGALFLMMRDSKTREVQWLPYGTGMRLAEAMKFLHDHDPP